MAFEYAVVLTGSIGTGKSTAVTFLSQMGFSIIDADTIAHQVLQCASSKISEMFGKHVVVDGTVDRKALGSIVFEDKSKRKLLESLVHPLIYDKIEEEAKALDGLKKPYIIDIPLFFEGNRYPIKKSIVVYAPKGIQVSRVMLRDGYSKEEALKRIASQLDIEIKRERASYVIENTHDLQQLENECKRVKVEIIGDFK